MLMLIVGTGAALLSGTAALRTGSGLVTLAVPASLQPVVAGRVPELMTIALPETEPFLVDAARAADAVARHPHTALVLGPGLRPGEGTTDLVMRIIEGSGGGGSVKTIETTGRANLPGRVGGTQGYYLATINLGTVPVVALGLGSVAGLGAARLAASHYSVMTKTTSAMFVAGPPVVERIGQKLSKQELGGWEIQTRSGAVDHAVDTEEDAFACARRFLSYLPASVHATAPVVACDDDPNRRDEMLLDAIPKDRRRVYKMRPIIETLVDKGSFFELGRMFGRSIITGFARLEGRSVAIMAGDPFHYAGAWTADACAKVVRFVDLAQTFHLPVVHLVDCPGFLVGLDAEKTATIRGGVRAMAAISQTTVPWCSVIVRNVFGVAGAIHQPSGRLSLRYAWPSGDWGSLPIEGGVQAAYKREIEAAPDPVARRREIEAMLNELRSPFRTAEAFGIEEIIDPRETRSLLCEWVATAYELVSTQTGPKQHGLRP